MGFLQRLRKLAAKKQRRVKVSWIGLDRAGKTTLIKQIIQKTFDAHTKRTLGMNVDEFEVAEGLVFTSWDIGGQIAFRSTLWEAYMAGSMGVIYVVDSSDTLRFPEAHEELWRYVMNNPKVENNIPILVLANKQDLGGAVSAGEVALALGLDKVTTHSYAILPVSAKTGFNIEEALCWLGQRIKDVVDRM
ncbi:MAG: ADP-ribosylation factor family protein [Candidatus Hodarchaeota archaeon]